tara:strand:- start:1912 stop:2904 length:993 start_codon:yes stop_codon:yes gene_type:complete
LRINRIKEILRNYRFGRSSPRENQIINRWYASLDNQHQEVSKEELEKLGQNILKEINKKIEINEQNFSTSSEKKKVVQFDFRYLLKITAVFVLGIIIVSMLVFNRSSINGARYSRVEVKVNEIHLSDGSIVWLKSDSKLTYPDEFAQNSREVHLEGEAFFDVFRDENRPFIIHTQDLITKVLGTSFNVKDYKKGTDKAVEVLTGSVQVSLNRKSGSQESVVLKSREKINLNKAKSSGAEVLKKDIQVVLPESTKELKFEEASVNEIIEKLNLVHGVKIRVKNQKLNTCRLTADLSFEKLDVCLEIISRALNAKYYQIENQIYIDGKGCLN